ncbi:MAG: terminase large subunit domain-containing protein [Bacteroidales bacterium]
MNVRRILKNIIGKCIEYVERLEFIMYDFDESDIDKKIIHTEDVQGLSVKTDMGFSPVSYIHKTQPYQVYEISFSDGSFIECADNHIVFTDEMCEKYIRDVNIGDKLFSERGIITVTNIYKTPYKLSMYDLTVEDFNHRYYTNNVLSHNTTTTVSYIAWYLCFHTDRNIAVLANKQDTAIEIMDKLINVFKGLPFYLKPGVSNIGKKGIKLDNGCQIMAQATTKTATIGFTIHVLYMDECAHVQPNIMSHLWRSIYPTMSSSEVSQCIVSSTPNGAGDNRFFRIWDGALRKTNSFLPIRVDWWQIPGKDEAWAKKERADIGDEEFDQEYGLSFNVSSKYFFKSHDLSFLNKIKQTYNFEEIDNMDVEVELYDSLTWHPDFDLSNVNFNGKGRRFLLSVDTGEGKDSEEDKENDYNVFHVLELKLKSVAKMRELLPSERTIKNMFRLVQVGIYRNNIADESKSALVARDLVFNVLGEDNTKVNIEMNFNGKNWVTHFSSHLNYEDNVFVKTYHTKPIPGEKAPNKKIGYKTNATKEWYCKAGRKLVENRALIPTEAETIREMGSFGKDTRGRLTGVGVKDDTTIAMLMVTHFTEQADYDEWCDELFEELPMTYEKRFATELLKYYTDTSIETEYSDELMDIIF